MIEPRDLRRLRWYATALAGSIDDPDALAQVVAIQGTLDREITWRVRELVAGGFSWDDIARALGCTRQTAWRKYSSAAARGETSMAQAELANQLD